jgi:hypothetical protein
MNIRLFCVALLLILLVGCDSTKSTVVPKVKQAEKQEGIKVIYDGCPDWWCYQVIEYRGRCYIVTEKGGIMEVTEKNMPAEKPN